MPRNRVQIQFKTLSILLGGDVGINPSAEDATVIDGYIDDMVSMINKKKITYIADPNELDDELFEPFCQLVANAAANEYGSNSDPAKGRYYENEIRVIQAQTPGYGPQIVSYF